MKTIFVPTDNSIVAQMAAQYAAALANATRAQLILFHAYHLPIPTSDLPGGIPSSKEEEKLQLKKLNAIKHNLEEAYQVSIRCVVEPGMAAEVVPLAAKQLSADLIVMGTGRSQDLAKSLFGHVTTHIINRTAVPMLVVPEGAAFEHPAQIVLASDFNVQSSKVSLDLFKELVRHFGATVHILHVAKPEPAWSGPAGELLVENRLEDLEHVYEVVEDSDPAHGIERYLSKNKPDWVVMLPHRYSLLKGVFHKSCTEKIALHTRIPLLVLPEQK